MESDRQSRLEQRHRILSANYSLHTRTPPEWWVFHLQPDISKWMIDSIAISLENGGVQLSEQRTLPTVPVENLVV